MKEIFTMIGTIVGSLLAGSFISWLYFIKIKRPKNVEEAVAVIAGSKENDKDREKLIAEIKAQINLNKRLREEMEKKLK